MYRTQIHNPESGFLRREERGRRLIDMCVGSPAFGSSSCAAIGATGIEPAASSGHPAARRSIAGHGPSAPDRKTTINGLAGHLRDTAGQKRGGNGINPEKPTV